jgi:hypothetical protein
MIIDISIEREKTISCISCIFHNGRASAHLVRFVAVCTLRRKVL